MRVQKRQETVKMLTTVNTMQESVRNSKGRQQIEVLARLRDITKLETIDEMVEEYQKLEDKHVRAMKYFNLINEEVRSTLLGCCGGDSCMVSLTVCCAPSLCLSPFLPQYVMLRNEKHRLQDRVQLQKQRSAASDRKQSRKEVDDLQRRIDASLRNQKALQTMLAKQYNTLEMAKSTVFRSFLVVGCDDEALKAKLDMEGITDDNIMNVLGIIEQKVNWYTNKVGSPRRGIKEKKFDNVVTIVPPNTTDQADSSDDDTRPMSHNQLLQELKRKQVKEMT